MNEAARFHFANIKGSHWKLAATNVSSIGVELAWNFTRGNLLTSDFFCDFEQFSTFYAFRPRDCWFPSD
ncbi:hypothetical protein RMSM_00938 [Rhodopirellula maiorica SM1]|uniref:Uncharacterized protein n=1 Tax=Rhodopirellula maiorica SM1 TaxID=1265738 RepID=M5RS10_9BACT|nr:hypothetical protein RMSM_00938 [Rhodopirellula maiorica SM1]